MMTLKNKSRPLLILGGTREAVEVCLRLSDFAPLIYSTKSATARFSNLERLSHIRLVSGGFGGVDGMCKFLNKERISAVLDLTHPYASNISKNAQTSASQLDILYFGYIRPPWKRQLSDLWHEFYTYSDLFHALPDQVCAFISLGKSAQNHFGYHRSGQKWLVSVFSDVVIPYKKGIKVAHLDPPFENQAIRKLLLDHKINALVAKNSGDSNGYEKIKIARDLKIPVFILKREKNIYSDPKLHYFDTLENMITKVERLSEHI